MQVLQESASQSTESGLAHWSRRVIAPGDTQVTGLRASVLRARPPCTAPPAPRCARLRPAPRPSPSPNPHAPAAVGGDADAAVRHGAPGPQLCAVGAGPGRHLGAPARRLQRRPGRTLRLRYVRFGSMLGMVRSAVVRSWCRRAEGCCRACAVAQARAPAPPRRCSAGRWRPPAWSAARSTRWAGPAATAAPGPCARRAPAWGGWRRRRAPPAPPAAHCYRCLRRCPQRGGDGNCCVAVHGLLTHRPPRPRAAR